MFLQVKSLNVVFKEQKRLVYTWLWKQGIGYRNKQAGTVTMAVYVALGVMGLVGEY